MAQPPDYTRQADFTSYQTNNPGQPMNGASLDSEYNAVKATLDVINKNIALIQRDDTALLNGAVHPDSLSTAVKALIASTWTPKGLWATAVSYVVGDVVESSGESYVCASAHTSAAFADDHAAGKWIALAPLTQATLQAGTTTFAQATGTADAMTATFAPTITAYTDGMELRVRSVGANTIVAPTINAKTLTRLGNQALLVGDIPRAGYELLIRYNATNDVFELLNPAVPLSAFGRTLLDDMNADEAKDTLRLQVNGISSLAGIAPISGERIYLNYHTSEGDSGGGIFRAATGAAAGTYTDNGGTVIVPTGGDGSTAWLRVFSGAVSVRWFGATEDGATDDRGALSRADTAGLDCLIITGAVRVASNLTLSTPLHFLPGGKLIPDAAVTVTITAEYHAPQQVIFDYSLGGLFDLKAQKSFSISHFSGVSANKKFDNLKASLVNHVPYELTFPIPRANEEGAVEWTGGGNDWRWLLDGTLTITNDCNYGTIWCVGEFGAQTNIGTGIRIGDAAKPENVNFPLGFTCDGAGAAKLTTGLEITACSRIYFGHLAKFDNVISPIVIGGPSQVEQIGAVFFENIHAGFCEGAILRLEGSVSPWEVADIHVRSVRMDTNSIAGLTEVVMSGLVKDVVIGDVFYQSGGTGSDLQDGVLIQTNGYGSPFNIRIGGMFLDNCVGNALITEDTTAGTAARINRIFVGPTYAEGAGGGMSLAWLTFSEIHVTEEAAAAGITFGAGAEGFNLVTHGRGSSLSPASQVRVNGFGTRAEGVGNPPRSDLWEIGETVMNGSDSTVWIKYRHTGVSVDDFIKIA